jgi:hypothetical protein
MAASSRSLVSWAIRSVWRELRSTSSAPRRSSGLSMDRATCLLASKKGVMNGPYASKISVVGPMFARLRVPWKESIWLRSSPIPSIASSAGR